MKKEIIIVVLSIILGIVWAPVSLVFGFMSIKPNLAEMFIILPAYITSNLANFIPIYPISGLTMVIVAMIGTFLSYLLIKLISWLVRFLKNNRNVIKSSQ